MLPISYALYPIKLYFGANLSVKLNAKKDCLLDINPQWLKLCKVKENMNKATVNMGYTQYCVHVNLQYPILCTCKFGSKIKLVENHWSAL